MTFFVLFILAVIGWTIWVSVKINSNASNIAELSRQLALQQMHLRSLEAGMERPDTRAATRTTTEAPSAEAEDATKPDEGTSAKPTTGIASEPETAEEIRQPATIGWNNASKTTVPPVGSTARPAFDAETARGTFEQLLGTRWMIWLGGVAIAFGAVFLVQYSIQRGYFSPPVRIAGGVLLSAILLALGEVARRQPSLVPAPELHMAQIPPVLTASGLVAAYATTYAAYGLYDMIGPTAAFMLLGLLSVAAMLLAGLHTTYIGAIGLVSAVLTPALIHSDAPRPEILFLYLTFVLGTSIVTSNLRDWRRLSAVAIGMSLIWPLLWLVNFMQPGDEVAIGMHLLVLYALQIGLNWKRGPVGTDASRADEALLSACALVTGGLLLLLVFANKYGLISLCIFAPYTFMSIAAAWRDEKFGRTLGIATSLTVIGIGCWPLPHAAWAGSIDVQPTRYVMTPILPQALDRFLTTSALAGLLFALSGYAKLIASKSASDAHYQGSALKIWALIAGFAPLLLFVIAYVRVKMFEVSVSWAFVSLALAIIAAVATHQMSRWRSKDEYEFATATFATTTLSFLVATFAIVLRNEWLTIALALLVPGLAWVQSYLPVRMLERLAVTMAGIVTVRLVLNPALLNYDIGSRLIFNTLLYGYGVPAVSFAWSAWYYRHMARDEIANILEAAALVIGMVLVNLEINHAFAHGKAFSTNYGLAQHGSHLIVWLFTSIMLYRLNLRHPRWHYREGALFLRGLSYLNLAVGLTILSPLVTSVPFTGPLFFDSMFLAYLVPAMLAAYYARMAKRTDAPLLAIWTATAAALAGFTYYTLEVRRFFHDGSIAFSKLSTEGENYAYSAAWLVLGGLALLAAFITHERWLRLASLGLVMLVVVKVFLFDMASLTGILRAASFLGLGIALLAIGLFYQKVVFASGKETGAD